jgi:MoaA/NifB/PqqE/SkfB family radical SAM enzyme
MEGILPAWGRILAGHTPALSIEITRECPLRCPGCYAYGDDHLGGELTLREIRDFKGQELIDGVLALADRHRPIYISIVGGEPLVRYRELDTLLPMLAARRIHVQLVTSAVREIPQGWRTIPRLSICVSIDGLQPEHDERRAPATYDRILKHIVGHSITVHCTVTRQQVIRPAYIEDFIRFWSAREEDEKIWISLYTPQIGEVSAELLRPADRAQVVGDLLALRLRYLCTPSGPESRACCSPDAKGTETPPRSFVNEIRRTVPRGAITPRACGYPPTVSQGATKDVRRRPPMVRCGAAATRGLSR